MPRRATTSYPLSTTATPSDDCSWLTDAQRSNRVLDLCQMHGIGSRSYPCRLTALDKSR